MNEWTSVLRLASERSFHDIQNLALRKLDLIATPVDKLVISHKYDLPHWLLDAYISLCVRGKSLSVTEIKALPAEDVALIIEVRERYIPDLAAKRDKIERHVTDLLGSINSSRP